MKHEKTTSFGSAAAAHSARTADHKRFLDRLGLAEPVRVVPLVTVLKTVDQGTLKLRAAGRLGRFAAKAEAARLLLLDDEKAGRRTSHCGYVANADEVALVRRADGKASFTGLRTCGAIWYCPVCAPRIAEKRKLELDALLSGARAKGYSIVLMTLTARHDRETDLAGFLSALKGAAKRLRQRREWRALPLVGSVVATEVTHGGNGWHPHFHVLMVLDAPQADAVQLVETLRTPWLVSLAGFDLSGNQAAFDAADGSAAGAYIQKFGAAEEVTLSTAKKGRSGSRTPWQLLDDAVVGDLRARALWREYARCFRARRQLVWSQGLKAVFGIDDVSDEAAAAEPEPEPVVLRVWRGAKAGLWSQARRRRCALLDAAEAGTDLDAAEFGPTDAERWRREGGDASVLEGLV